MDFFTHSEEEAKQPERTPLHAARVAHGLTVQELAGLAGINPQTLYRLERGIGRPRRTTQIVLAAFLDANPADLFPAAPNAPRLDA